MPRSPAATTGTRGLFVVGTDTNVGKTFVAARIAAALRKTGRKVGVYKPAASGCRREGKTLVSDDAVALWESAGRPGNLEAVCPQRFEAPLAPHLAARESGLELDAAKLRAGLKPWLKSSEIVIVEGAGGLMSPFGDDEYNADLAADFGFPLIVVAADRLGTINQTLQTLIAAACVAEELTIAGIVLNEVRPPADDPSCKTNEAELRKRSTPPLLTRLKHGAADFATKVDWWNLAGPYKGKP